jgi:formate-dependent nitrite reductase cytochrome c552 subunit
MHGSINLKHGKFQWCLNCHSTDERNYLELINGDIISFEESYQLCGQCHGTIYRDWKLGIHGRRVGQWNGKKLYVLCDYCHDPHSPKFRKIMPKDRPRLPSYGRWESEDKHH